jgi:hypothetical protein
VDDVKRGHVCCGLQIGEEKNMGVMNCGAYGDSASHREFWFWAGDDSGTGGKPGGSSGGGGEGRNGRTRGFEAEGDILDLIINVWDLQLSVCGSD